MLEEKYVPTIYVCIIIKYNFEKAKCDFYTISCIFYR